MTTASPRPEVAERPDFDTVFEALGPEIYRYLRRQAPTAEDAADLHQETFLRAFRSYGRLPGNANVRAWLYRIAGNLATDLYRRRRTAGSASAGRLDDPSGTEPGSPHPGPDAVAQAGELRDAVRVALTALSPHQRAAVALRVFDDRPYEEVAALLDCSELSARQHVSQGLRRLRAALEPWR